MRGCYLIWIIQILLIAMGSSSKYKIPKKIEERKPAPKFDNPDNVRDRERNFHKPHMPEEWVKEHRAPFTSAWMDYCDPYHCNDYHRRVCGLNRKKLRFQWFQSGCHLILNNMCATFRGNLKYDVVEDKFCTQYVKFLRNECPSSCEGLDLKPVCAVSLKDNRVVLFKNQCGLKVFNCQDPNNEDEFQEINMKYCVFYLTEGVETNPGQSRI